MIEPADVFCACPDPSPRGGWCDCGHPSAGHGPTGCLELSDSDEVDQ